MSFHGLFVGIDRYESPSVPNLTCSSRDAEALYALFGDTFGTESSTLLTNEQATRQAIFTQFQGRLWSTGDEDVVVLYFSGHGSDSHHLVTYDADPLNFDTTTLPLDELTELFAHIPARNVILFLDCCFAGGAGAKVFYQQYAKKAASTIGEVIAHISGKGRVIFTAVTADQEAIEDRKKGHSVFTYHLVEGLRGAPEVIRDGRIPLLALIDFVTRRVTESARQIRHTQEPSLRGTADGECSFPVLTPGRIYGQYFPERDQIRIGLSVRELACHGFPPDLLEELEKSFSTLNELQQEAINDYALFEGNHVVVSAPTSSGKTMIGELAALKAYLNRERTYFLLPLRALVNDKFDEFVRKYSGYGLRVIRSTGEIADDNDALFRGKFDLALLTYEKFAALALTNPHLLCQVGLVVIDEVQMIADRTRGVNLEFILTLLRTQRRFGVEPQIIALSAVIGDTNGLEGWLSARLLRSEKRPVPIEEGMIGMGGALRFVTEAGEEKRELGFVVREHRKGSSQDIIVPLVRKLTASGESVIVFRETKPLVRATANYLTASLGLPPAQPVIEALPTGDPSEASGLLRQCLMGGVAFHNADLDREERRVIERMFRDPDSSLRVLVSTTTLAMGVNTPASSVVIAGLEHPDGEYAIAEYKNMVGRAGRLGFTPKGRSFLIALSSGEEQRLWTKYVKGKPEGVVSRFTEKSPLSLVCRILATAAAVRVDSMSEEDLFEFIDGSFAAHQSRMRTGVPLWDRQILRDAVRQLLYYGLVSDDEGQYRLTDLGRVVGELGIEVLSAVRIVEALRGVPGPQLTGVALIAAAQVSEELNEVIFPVHRKSHQERARWQGMMQQLGLPPQILRALRATAKDDADYTTRCKKVAAALMWIDGTELRLMEASLLRHLPADNAAGPIRAVADRMRDMLPAVARIAEILCPGEVKLGAQVESLSIRLELGIPEEIVWLGSVLGSSLERGDYIALIRGNVTVPEAFFGAQEDALLALLNDAQKVKIVQLGRRRLEEKMKRDAMEDVLPMPRILSDHRL